MNEQKYIWDNYWRKNLKHKILKFFRKNIISKEVHFYANSYLPDEGIILECGSGSGESSIYLSRDEKRTFIAVDISLSALKLAREKNIYKYFVVGDIYRLPFKEKTISGIFNIGVMEHFTERQLKIILLAFKDVLVKKGRIVIFWPYALAPFVILHTILTTLVLFPFYIISRKYHEVMSKKIHSGFSEGHWLFLRQRKTKKLLNSCGFVKIKFKLSLFFLLHCVVYLEK